MDAINLRLTWACTLFGERPSEILEASQSCATFQVNSVVAKYWFKVESPWVVLWLSGVVKSVKLHFLEEALIFSPDFPLYCTSMYMYYLVNLWK